MNNDVLVRYPSKQTELLWKYAVRHVGNWLYFLTFVNRVL